MIPSDRELREWYTVSQLLNFQDELDGTLPLDHEGIALYSEEISHTYFVHPKASKYSTGAIGWTADGLADHIVQTVEFTGDIYSLELRTFVFLHDMVELLRYREEDRSGKRDRAREEALALLSEEQIALLGIK